MTARLCLHPELEEKPSRTNRLEFDEGAGVVP